MPRIYNWTSFWILWGGGWLIFFGLILASQYLIMDASGSPILDHQRAGTAVAVDLIQNSWAAAGKTNFAIIWFTVELVFIAILMSGGIIGGRLIWFESVSTALKKTGLFIIVTIFLFGVTDYIETICQFIQLLRGQGSDTLASIAAIFSPIKVLSFILANTAMIIALIWRKSERDA